VGGKRVAQTVHTEHTEHTEVHPRVKRGEWSRVGGEHQPQTGS